MDAPIAILQKEVSDVTDFPVRRVDMIPADRFYAAKMRITVVRSCFSSLRLVWSAQIRRCHAARKAVIAHIESTTPIRRPSIVIVDIGFHLP